MIKKPKKHETPKKTLFVDHKTTMVQFLKQITLKDIVDKEHDVNSR